MRLHVPASLLTLLCSWVLWEKHILYNPDPERFIQAVHEDSTLIGCRGALPNFSKKKGAAMREAYPESEYSVTHNDADVSVMLRRREKGESRTRTETLHEFVFYCLPSTVDPYKDAR
jgi:hypothetical protein